MTEQLLRDITGKCEGECENIVRQAEERRQGEINSSGVSYSGPSKSVPWARSRNEQPGVWGGHV
ncbi:MAG: hypothetical protein RBR67_00460 [Desulfobacterium sp.]|jgi:hypothetical protein|nr:hypothetical protein [Desulfobacterium sp.]